MWFLKMFAIITPVWILWCIVTGEISMMNQMDKTRSIITASDEPIAFWISIIAFVLMEYFLIREIHKKQG